MAESLKEISNRNLSAPNSPYHLDTINTSCLMRIADASEKMASNYTKLQDDLEHYKKGYNRRWELIEQRDRTISALRGQITKLKNQLKKLNA